MVGSDFNEEMDCSSFFDQFDDLIEFPADNKCNDFHSIWSNTSDAFPGSGPLFPGNSNSGSDLSAELAVPVPYEDAVHLEWLSNFMDDSFPCEDMTLGQQNPPLNKEASHNQFQTSSPVSVLESSSSSSSSSSSEKNVMPLSPTQHGPQRARSKRARPANFHLRPAIQLISPTSSESENLLESHPVSKIPKAEAVEHKKKKKIKLSLPLRPPVEKNPNHPPSQSLRKCMHCQISKTPQWRAGPMGPKTLCNACGVRFKSGRLFPEYRPAASPTFVPSLHSNSHKKVVEMRSKSGDKISAVMNSTTVEPELIPNSDPPMGYI